jgi:hypothetical protein
MKYRKKPVVVEVYHYRKPLYELDVFNNLPDWMKQARQNGTLYYYYGELILNGNLNMKVSIGDYIIKGVRGELYPCKPDIFEETYEKA